MPIDRKLKSHCISTLRRAWLRSPERNNVMKAARVDRGLYVCAICLEVVRAKEINIDHIDPVVDPAVGWVDFDTFIERLHCTEDKLQCVCKTCHDEKTKDEREVRRNTKKVLTRKAKKRTIKKTRKRRL